MIDSSKNCFHSNVIFSCQGRVLLESSAPWTNGCSLKRKPPDLLRTRLGEIRNTLLWAVQFYFSQLTLKISFYAKESHEVMSGGCCVLTIRIRGRNYHSANVASKITSEITWIQNNTLFHDANSYWSAGRTKVDFCN